MTDLSAWSRTGSYSREVTGKAGEWRSLSDDFLFSTEATNGYGFLGYGRLLPGRQDTSQQLNGLVGPQTVLAAGVDQHSVQLINGPSDRLEALR
jgi:hypothetical protein